MHNRMEVIIIIICRDKRNINNKTKWTQILINNKWMTDRRNKQEHGMTGKMQMRKELETEEIDDS